jgi:CubicO group peptidase (beta-lactamase class C family)
MSASKTTVSLTATMLWEEGKLDVEKPNTDYVPDLKGTAWDAVSVKNAMNMSSGLDVEETFESLTNPKSFIAGFMTRSFESGHSSWREWAKSAQPLPNEKPGDKFRYSTCITLILVVMVENITQMPWQEYWDQRVWSKIGARSPFSVALAPDGTPGAAGLNITTIEDMLRYALLYTPSWNKVAKEKVISDKMLKFIQDFGNPEAYVGSGEEAYGQRWFGETPYTNTAQWDHSFKDGAMFKHGNMGQGIYVDPARDFCGCYFGLATNDESISGVDHSPGYLRAAAKLLTGG